MKIRLLVAVAFVILACATVACSEDADAPVVTPSVTSVASTATTIAPTPQPTSTPHATPIAEAATLAGCPRDDDALCQFALDAQDALNAEDLAFFESRLAPSRKSCFDASYVIGDDIGCGTSGAETSLPVVALLSTPGDCCQVRPEKFVVRFQEFLGHLQMEGTWRVYGIERRANQDVIVVVHGTAPDAAMVKLVSTSDGLFGIPGVIVGPISYLYVIPDSEFFHWR